MIHQTLSLRTDYGVMACDAFSTVDSCSVITQWRRLKSLRMPRDFIELQVNIRCEMFAVKSVIYR